MRILIPSLMYNLVLGCFVLEESPENVVAICVVRRGITRVRADGSPRTPPSRAYRAGMTVVKLIVMSGSG